MRHAVATPDGSELMHARQELELAKLRQDIAVLRKPRKKRGWLHAILCCVPETAWFVFSWSVRLCAFVLLIVFLVVMASKAYHKLPGMS